MKRVDQSLSSPDDPSVPPELLEAWTRRLYVHYGYYNHAYLDDRLRPPIFRISASRGRLGQWDREARSISISRHHILTHSWEAVLDTLRHEMAHQYVDEVLHIPGAPPHGAPFARACRLLRCDPGAHAGSDQLPRIDSSTDERDRMLRRVKELLALAGSPNEHEAANAMRLAHKYLLRYNLDLNEPGAAARYETRHLGPCSGRVPEYRYTLSSILQDHFFVLVIWTDSYDPRRDRKGRVLQISGTAENLEMAAYVYDYVTRLADRLWEDRRREGARGRGTRNQYLAGLLRGLREKLDLQSRELEDEHGLVWLGDPELGQYFRHLHPRTRSVSTSGVSRSDHFQAGVRDGRRIQIRKGIGEPARRRGRQLPRGS